MSNSVSESEIAPWLRTYLAAEESATEFRAHLPYVICGLLQTPEYAAAIARSVGVTPKDDEYVERTVRLRAVRQQRIRRRELTVTVIQSEFALRLQMGSKDTMAAQLAHLAKVSELPNVTVLVMPYEVGQYEALRIGSFTLLSNPRRSAPIVHLEGYNGGRLIEAADEAGYFVTAFDHARKLALPPDESRRFISQVAKEWEMAK